MSQYEVQPNSKAAKEDEPTDDPPKVQTEGKKKRRKRVKRTTGTTVPLNKSLAAWGQAVKICRQKYGLTPPIKKDTDDYRYVMEEYRRIKAQQE
jgi:hypothetical protein